MTLRPLRACLAALALGVAGCTGSSPGTTPRTLDGCVREGPGVAITSFSVGAGQEEPAAVLGSGMTGVVLSNESDRQLCSWVPFARILAGHGLRVLPLRLRHRRSDRRGPPPQPGPCGAPV